MQAFSPVLLISSPPPKFQRLQPGSVHVGNSVMTDTWQNLRISHYGLRPQVLGLETLFTLNTSAFQVPKFCCCGLLYYTYSLVALWLLKNNLSSIIAAGFGKGMETCRFQIVIFTQKLQSLLCQEI